MLKIRRALALLLAAALSFALVSCGKEKTPLEKLAGYYEADIAKVIEDQYPEDSSDDKDALEASLRSRGYVNGIKIDKEGNGTRTVEIDGNEQSSEKLVFDPDSGTVTVNGEKLNYTFSSRTIEIDGVSYVRTSGKSEAVWPFGAGVSYGGDEIVGSFWVPDDWYDETEEADVSEYVVTYVSPDEEYAVSAFNYTKEEWEEMDPAVFESPASLVDALTSNNRSKYASSLKADDTFEADVEGDEAVRNDMIFSEGDGITTVVSFDTEGTFRVFIFDTYSEEATKHMDEFVDYVLGHYHKEYY